MFVIFKQWQGIARFWTGGIDERGEPEGTTCLDEAAMFGAEGTAQRIASRFECLNDWTVGPLVQQWILPRTAERE